MPYLDKRVGFTPIYYNPTFDECLELAHEYWDTLRILVEVKSNTFFIASGLGNTHQDIITVAKPYFKNLGIRFPVYDDAIVYHEQGLAKFNKKDCVITGFNKLDDIHCDILRDIIRESNLVYNGD